MASKEWKSSSPQSHHLNDLDSVPDREVKVRILNDIPKETINTTPTPSVKFNFVDVTFPEPLEDLNRAGSRTGEILIKDSKRNKSYIDSGKHGRSRQQNDENKLPRATQAQVGGFETNRREFLCQLLNKGVPMWEEVPEEERKVKYIGGTNPFRNHPYQSNPMACNVTLRNSNKSKSKRTVNAVWEDEQDGSKNSYSLLTHDDVIDHPVDTLRHNDHNPKLSCVDNIPVPYLEYGQNHGQRHHLQDHASDQPDEIRVSPENISRHAPGLNTNQSVTSAEDYERESYHMLNYASSIKCSVEHGNNDQYKNDIQNVPSRSVSRSSEWVPELDTERFSRPVMKRKHGGRIEDNNLTASISWRPGDKHFVDRSKVEEEEKHEKESTKEKRSKRDLSASSQGQGLPPSRRHRLSPSKEAVSETSLKTPPRLRQYEQAEVQKFMEAKRLERLRAIKESKVHREQEKVKRDERLKELAARTKQLAQGGKSGGGREVGVTAIGNQVASDGNPVINWGCPEKCEHEVHKEQLLPDDKLMTQVLSKFRSSSEISKIVNVADITNSVKHSEEDGNFEKDISKERRKLDHKKKKKKLLSDSESISSIVSRTVEECEKQVRASNLSVDSYSSTSSVSVSSSDTESGSESLSSSLDLAPKERVLALSRMAEKLAKSIKKEERHLRHHEKQNAENPLSSRVFRNKDVTSEIGNKENVTEKRHKTIEDSILHMPHSERESLSVEELAAKMTSLLPKSCGKQGIVRDVTDSKHDSKVNHAQEKESLSVAELAAKMKCLLPEVYGIQGTGSKLCHSRHLHLLMQEKCKVQREVHIQDKKNKDLSKSQDILSNNAAQGVPVTELPNLVSPEVPNLQLAGGDTVKIGISEDLSSLPGNNVVQTTFNPHVLSNKKESYKGILYPHSWQGSSSEVPHIRKQPDLNEQKQTTFPRDAIRSNAALIVQAAYRGYRVRKITDMLLKKRDSQLRIYEHTSTKPYRQNIEDSHKPLKQNIAAGLQDDPEQEGVLSVEQEKIQIDWRQIRAEIGKRTFNANKGSRNSVQKSDLPDWIKPYIILSETGDVEGFVESRVKELPYPGQVTNEKHEGYHIENISRQRTVEKDSDIEDMDSRSTLEQNEALTEGLLSDLKGFSVQMYEKETQTSAVDSKLMRSKHIVRDKGKTYKKHGDRGDENQEFFDLRRKFKGKTILALQSKENHKADVLRVATKKDTATSVVAPPLEVGQGGSRRVVRATHDASPPLECTLEEGPIKELDLSLQQPGSDTSDIEEGLIVESSGILESSNGNDSVSTEEILAPHELLRSGIHFGPASLRQRVNAELMYQDTLGEALNQLQNVNHLNILTKSQHDALSLSQSLAAQQQNIEYKAQQEKIIKEEKRKEEEKSKKEHDKKMKDEIRQNHEVLRSIEKMEIETRDRVAALERELLAKAEQVLSKAVEKKPESNCTQPDVIAAAAVAAVGATISQWERLRPMQKPSSQGQVSGLSAQYSAFLSQQSSSSIELHSRQEVLSVDSQSLRSTQNKNFLCGSELGNITENSVSKDYAMQEQSFEQISTNQSSVDKEVSTEIDKSQHSASENTMNGEGSNTVAKHITGKVDNYSKTPSALSYNESISEYLVNNINSEKKNIAFGSSLSGSTVVEDIEEGFLHESISEVVTEEIGSQTSRSDEKVNEKELVNLSLLESVKECLDIETDIICVVESTSTVESTATEYSQPSSASITTEYSEHLSAPRNKTIPLAVAASISSQSHSLASSAKQDFQHLSRSHAKKQKTFQPKDQAGMKKGHSSSSIQTSPKSERSRRERHYVSDGYSESFEVDSSSDSTAISSTSHSQDKHQGGYRGDLSLVVSSGKGMAGAANTGGCESALGMTLGLVESLQKEEEVRHQHQMALLKLQEQSLIEEARWKLSALHSEGGPGLRKRQRAVLLQLREQRAHLRRLIETQNIAAQQRRIMLLQHHHLLATTTAMSVSGSRSHALAAWGHSPGPSSPRLTPRMMELGASSSSDVQDDISLNYLLRGRDTGSSSPSDGGGREKRRSHSEERMRMPSYRMQDKRRAAETEVEQQLLHEEKEVLRLKVKSPYDSHDKESMISKRKEFISKRSRDKRDRSPSAVSPLVHVQSNRNLTDSSVQEESFEALTQDSQSSVPEEGGSETLSHSDIASSISEQEGLASRNNSSLSSKETTYSKKLSVDNIQSKRDLSASHSSNIMMALEDNEQLQEMQENHKESRTSEGSSPIRTQLIGESRSGSAVEQDFDKLSSVRAFTGKEMASTIQSDTSEQISEALDLAVGSKSCSTPSDTIQSKSMSSASIETDELKLRMSPGSSRLNSETPSGSEIKSSNTKSNEVKSNQKLSSNKALPLPLRVPLSPRSPHRQRRRYSSESDDSFTLSQTETASDISDGEGKLLALKEQLAARRAEAERLKKEKRRLRRERLGSQERALRQQISTYDAYIQQAKLELEKESRELQQASMVKPLIKKPQVAETRKSKLSDGLMTSPEKSEVSDLSLVSESSKSDQSHLSKAQEIHADEPYLAEFDSEPVKVEVKDAISEKVSEYKFDERQLSNIHKTTTHDADKPREESDSVMISPTSSISEEYSYEEGSISESVHEKSSSRVPSSRDSSADTDHSPSRASSTDTIVHSPKKVCLSLNNEDSSLCTEVSPSQTKAQDTGNIVYGEELMIHEESLAQNDTLSVFQLERETEPEEKCAENERSGRNGSVQESKSVMDTSVVAIRAEGEAKLDIFMPTFDSKKCNEVDTTDQNIDVSAKESIAEEIGGDNEESENKDHEPSKINILFIHSSKENSVEYDGDTTQSLSLSLDKKVPQKLEDTAEVTIDVESKVQLPTDDECGKLEEAAERRAHLASDDEHEKTKEIVQSQAQPSSGCGKADEAVKIHALVRQRLVDDVSNNLLASMLRETSQLFIHIMKTKTQTRNKIISDGTRTPSAQMSKTILDGENIDAFNMKEAIDSNESSSALGSSKEDVSEVISEDLSHSPYSSVEEHSKDIDDLHSPKSSTSSKSKILQRVCELISEGGSPSSTSCPSSRPGDLQLTPQLTFDLSPDVSPTSPVPGEEGTLQKHRSTEEGKAGDPDSVVDPASSAVPISAIALATAGTPVSVVAPTLPDWEDDDHAVSPSHDIIQADHYSLDMKALTSRLLDLPTSLDLDLDSKLDQLGENTEFSVEGIEGDWFDDDFWTSADSKKKQQQLKAEEERIAAEIARLEELQHLQEQYPGLVFREVPKHPPPPYSSTPPSSPPTKTSPPAYSLSTSDLSPPQTPEHSLSSSHRLSKADQRKVESHVTQVVPFSQEEALPIISDALENLYEAWEKKLDPSLLEPPTALVSASPSSERQEEETVEDDQVSGRAFHLLLFNLARELVAKPYKIQTAPPPSPWVKRSFSHSQILCSAYTKSRGSLFSHVKEQVENLCGWRQSKEKESLMVRWAQKHRDRVDQVLVKELQTEEVNWTNYDEDEVAVKTQVAEEILYILISETATLFASILARKRSYML